MRMWPKHWHPETWICSLRGHVAPAMWATDIGPDDPMGVVTSTGHRLARCMRCDCWVPHPDPAVSSVRFERVPDIENLAKPRRGAALREAIVMRLIAINKATHAIGFTLIAITLSLVRTNLFALQDGAQRVLTSLRSQMDQTGQQHSQDWVQRQLERVLNLKGHALGTLLFLAIVYATIEWSEAVGLWFERRWAEYLTVIATAGFLPIEIHELIDRVTFLRIGALIINVALVIWLVRTKRLFGLRGGRAAAEAFDDVDWPDVMIHPTPATGRLKP